MSDELKVCPFCGGDARIHSKVLAEGFDSGYWAVCDECGKGDTLPHESEEEAEAAWNARAAVTDEQFAMAVHDGRVWQRVRECRVVGEWKRLSRTQEVRACSCSECGHEFGVSRRNSKPFAYEAPCELPNFCPNCGAKVAPC